MFLFFKQGPWPSGPMGKKDSELACSIIDNILVIYSVIYIYILYIWVHPVPGSLSKTRGKQSMDRREDL